MNITILDCTLRDGGYVNNWRFGKNGIADIHKKLIESKVDIVECGFLKSEITYDENASLYSSINQIESLLPQNNTAFHVAMINCGEYSAEMLPYADCSPIKGIRVVFHKDETEQALELSREIKAKGYNVFIQPMATSTFSDSELLHLLEKVNRIKPYAFYVVDTHGSMYPKDLLRMFYLIDNNLSSEIYVGFHSHNNLQLSFSNAQELLKLHTKRNIIIDSSVFGMGRGAGNLCTELIAQYVNSNIEKKYVIVPLLEIIDEHLANIKLMHPWGYETAYYLSAVNQCHPNYSSFLLNKQAMSVKQISEMIGTIDDNKKSVYSKEHISQIYLDYQKNGSYDIDDTAKLKGLFDNRTLLILFPGNSVISQQDKIRAYINENDPLIVSVNFIPENFVANILFVGNGKRFKQIGNLKNLHSLSEIVATSNLYGQFDSNDINYVDYKSLIADNTDIPDNSGLMLFRFFIKLGVKNISVAGFDGFSPDVSTNYFDNSYKYQEENEQKLLRTQYITEQLNIINNVLQINFITNSLYCCNTVK